MKQKMIETLNVVHFAVVMHVRVREFLTKKKVFIDSMLSLGGEGGDTAN